MMTDNRQGQSANASLFHVGRRCRTGSNDIGRTARTGGRGDAAFLPRRLVRIRLFGRCSSRRWAQRDGLSLRDRTGSHHYACRARGGHGSRAFRQRQRDCHRACRSRSRSSVGTVPSRSLPESPREAPRSERLCFSRPVQVSSTVTHRWHLAPTVRCSRPRSVTLPFKGSTTRWGSRPEVSLQSSPVSYQRRSSSI